jgi:SAM-dependent methyltransferase
MSSTAEERFDTPSSEAGTLVEGGADPNPHKRDIDEGVQFSLRQLRNHVADIPGGLEGLRGKHFIEIGPGQDFGVALLFLCFCERSYVVDPYLAPWKEEFHSEYYNALLAATGKDFPSADLSPIEEVIANHGHRADGFVTLARPLEDVAEIPSNSIDIALSNATFEHLPDSEGAIRELFRITSPGGLGFHQVDFRDHRDFSRPLEYLTMSDDEFAIEVNERHWSCGNRLRGIQFLHLFEQMGFVVDKYERQGAAAPDYLNEVQSKIIHPFSAIPVGELVVLSGKFWTRKP